MNSKMTRTARAELAHGICRRYMSAAGNEKRGILAEFVAASGYHPKSAIRVLNMQSAPKHRQTRRRPSQKKSKLREVAATLDPLQLLEEMRAVQAHLAALADGDIPPGVTPEPPDLAAVRGGTLKRLAGRRGASYLLSRGQAALSAQSTKSRRAEARADLDACASCDDVTSSGLAPRRSCPNDRPLSMPSPVRPGSRRCAWCGRSRAADSKDSPTSAPHSSSKSYVHPVPRSIHPQAVQDARAARQSLAPGRLARAAWSLGQLQYRRLSDKPRGRRPDIFKDHLGRDGPNALKSVQIRLPSSFSLEFQGALPRTTTACDSCIRCSGEFGLGDSEAVQRLICDMRPAAQRYISLQINAAADRSELGNIAG